MVKRIVTGAHYGLRDWLIQRVTAVMMVAYVLLLVGMVIVWAPAGYADWKLLLGNGWMRIATFLFMTGLYWHAWVGMRNISMDYIHATGVRLFVQAGVILSLLFYAVWTADILWG